jgi:hypothetical protein
MFLSVPGSRRARKRRRRGRPVRSRSRGRVPTLRHRRLRAPRRHLSSLLPLRGSRLPSPRSPPEGTNPGPGSGVRAITRAGGKARGTGARAGLAPRSPRERDTCRHRTPGGGRPIRRRRRSCRLPPGIRSRAIRSLMTSRRRHRARPRPGAGRLTAAGRRARRIAPGSSRSPVRSLRSLARGRSRPSTPSRTWHAPAR